uniref:Secreted protein n=1 Tax=Rhabditophanes sp. KR3021 TaxID=114890 RepID=A0AC35TZA4_9BILA
MQFTTSIILLAIIGQLHTINASPLPNSDSGSIDNGLSAAIEIVCNNVKIASDAVLAAKVAADKATLLAKEIAAAAAGPEPSPADIAAAIAAKDAADAASVIAQNAAKAAAQVARAAAGAHACPTEIIA